jgi:hypothetical protein
MVRASTHAALIGHVDGAGRDPLDQLGWFDMLIAEPQAAVSILFEEQGLVLGASSALDAVVRTAFGCDPARDLPVLHPTAGGGLTAGSIVGHQLIVDGVSLGKRSALRVLVPTADTLVDVRAADLSWSSVFGVDADACLQRVRGTIGTSEVAPTRSDPDASPRGGVIAARRALAHELLGVGRAALEIGIDHVCEREQFGQSLAAFQTVRHQLADVHVALEAAAGVAGVAWDDPRPIVASAAKALAAGAARLAVDTAQQVCGALGFTWEHRLHRYLRRALLLDALYGSLDDLSREIGAELTMTASVPRSGRLPDPV